MCEKQSELSHDHITALCRCLLESLREQRDFIQAQSRLHFSALRTFSAETCRDQVHRIDAKILEIEGQLQ